MINDPNYFPAVVQVIVDAGYQILIYFDDGTIHRYDVEPLLSGPVFLPLRDPDFFRRSLTVMLGTVAWDLDGNRDEERCIDLDPISLYRETPVVPEPAWVASDSGAPCES